MAERAEVVFVDGVRTPFGRAGEKGMYWNTRADDLVVKAMIGLLERNPNLPKDRIDDVAIAATTQTGDQGLTLGRTAAILAGLPLTRSRLRDRPHVRRRDDRASPTIAGAIAFGAYDIAIAGGVEHMGRHPMGFGADPNPRFLAEKLVSADALNMGNTAERIHDRFPQLTKERADRFALAQPAEGRRRVRGRQDPARPHPGRHPQRGGLGPRHRATRACAPRPRWRASPTLKTPFRPHGRVTAGNASGLTDGATVCDPRVAAPPRRSSASPPRCAWSASPSPASSPRSWASARSRPPRRRCARPGLTIDDIGLFELNEAFAVQVLSFLDHFGIDDDDPRVNPWGGAIAIGHPLAVLGRAPHDPARAPVRPSAPTCATASPPCASASARAARSSGRTRTSTRRRRRPEDDRLLDHRLRLRCWPSPRRRGRHALVRARHPPARAARPSRSSPSTTAATTPARTRSAPATPARARRRCSTS